MPSVIVFGGYGVFGSRIAERLAEQGIPLTIAGRNLNKAEKFAARLGAQVKTREADVLNETSCREALQDQQIAVHCAGPYSENNLSLLEACLETGCHYVDIADNRRYIARLRDHHKRFLKKNINAVYGCSSLPGISGALASGLMGDKKESPQDIQVVLFIGNRNPKGAAALESLLKTSGETIQAPQGTLTGLGDKICVELPPPFGKVSAIDFDSSEYDLFPELFHARSVVVKVSFEWKSAVTLFALLPRLPSRLTRILRPLIRFAGNALGSRGSSGGAVSVQVTFGNGKQDRATAVAEKDGQQMAVTPALLAVDRLRIGSPGAGVRSAFEFLGSRELLQGLVREGFSVV